MYTDLRIIDTIEQLPETADEYFQMYYNRAHQLPIVTKDINERVINELYLAYQKYPDRSKRIKDIGTVLRIALNAKEHRHKKTVEASEVENALL